MDSLWDQLQQDSAIWLIPLYQGAGQPVGNPDFDPPEAWSRAMDAVARDLQCLRVGRDVGLHRLVWAFAIDPYYSVAIGWNGADDIGGFGRGEGMSMDAPYADAVAWVAETVQTDLAGYEFVQWRSRGRHLLVPQVREGHAVWVDPHDSTVVADIGSLCANK